jgi:very-short-patch-repair endonuclease
MDRAGLPFRRQQSILNFIVDFYCPRLGLVIEIDGPSHAAIEDMEYDQSSEAVGVARLRCDPIHK